MSATPSTAGSIASTSPPGRTIASTLSPTATNNGSSSSPRSVNEPDLLVLDEPFSGLDPLAITNMSALLTEVTATGTTVLFSSHQLDLVEHLCEDVVIIDHGHIVLAGDLDDLRAAVPQRFVDVHYRGAAPDWTALPGADLVDSTDGHARLRLLQHVDIAPIAAFVERNTSVDSFSYQPPTLSELFRQAVAA